MPPQQVESAADWPGCQLNYVHGPFFTPRAYFAAKLRIAQVYHARCMLDRILWLFPTLKSPLNRRRFQDIDKIREIKENPMRKMAVISKENCFQK